MEEHLYALWLCTMEGIWHKTVRVLREHFGSFRNVYNAQRAAYIEIEGITDRVAETLSNKNLDTARRILEQCELLGIDIVSLYDVQYPSVLRNMDDAPALLYAKGTLPSFQDAVAVAVVGSRRPSTYGVQMANQLAYDLGTAGVIIVSGMARGVDSAAHRGALKAGAKTVAVLGCGVDVVYPPENKELKKLIEANGAVISEFPPGTKPLPAHFPVRNRIISGLCQGVIITEGKASSGSTITARLALEQGKEVFCVPGNVDCPQSAAPNMLIKEGSAYLITGAQDVLAQLAENNPEQVMEALYSEAAMERKLQEKLAKLTREQRQIAEVLSANRPVHIDDICFQTGMEITLANQCLFQLEMKQYVKQLPGKQYILCL